MVKVEMKKERKKILPLMMAIGNKVMKELNLTERIDTAVKWDSTRWNISPGNLIKALILGTFTDMRAPLYHIGKCFQGVDIQYLFGDNATLDKINQYNVGEALDRLSGINFNGLYESIALDVVKKNGISTNRLHADTTTISFYGEYDEEEIDITDAEKEELLRIERGYNKDGKPLCKQIVVGHIVNEDGLVLSSRVMNGSTSDIEWNKKALKQFHNLVENGMKDGIFVADSKLVTKELVEQMNCQEEGVTFLSRCPANFHNKLESRMIARAYETGDFKDLGCIGKGKKASHYQGVSYVEEILGKQLRLLVLHSSVLEKKANQALEKTRQNLEPLVKELEKKVFACEGDAHLECERIKNHKKAVLFDCEFTFEKHTIEKWPRGRRTVKTKPTITENFTVKLDKLEFNKEAKERFLREGSCFVLISSVLSDITNDYELLEIYKGQQVVENSFRLLKEPCLASVIYLKKPERIEALSIVLTISLLIRAILQYRLRSGLKRYKDENPNKTLKAGWNGKPLENPTFKLLFEHTFSCYFEKEDIDHYSFSFGSEKNEFEVTTLLELMCFPLEAILV